MTAYPGGIDTFATKADGDASTAAEDNAQTVAIVALETKVGITGSAVTASHQYQLDHLATLATSASAADLSAGTLPAARMPALSGDVTTSAGAVATAIGANKVLLSMRNEQIPVLSADFVITTTTTPANVTDLVITVGTSATWIFDGFLLYDGDVTGDIAIDFVIPASATIAWSGSGPVSTLTGAGTAGQGDFAAITTSGGVQNYGASADTTPKTAIHLKGIVVTAGTGGTIQLQAAQRNATNVSTLRAGSYLHAWKKI